MFKIFFHLMLNFLLQVKTGLGEAMEGIGEEFLEEYKKQTDAEK